jgi:hypothetical protein
MPELVFSGTERARNRFGGTDCVGVPRASGPVFMFCALVIIFGGTESVGSRFQVLRARNRFGGTDGVRVPRASGPVFMF